MKKKRGMINTLLGAAIGITILIVVAVLGIVVLVNVGSSQAKCPATIGGGVATWNTATGYCENASGTQGTQGGTASADAWYAQGKMGSTSNGLLTWLPVVIPALVGIGIIAYFLRAGRVGAA